MEKVKDLLNKSVPLKVRKTRGLITTSGKGKLFDVDGNELDIRKVTKENLIEIIADMYQNIKLMRQEYSTYGMSHQTYDVLDKWLNSVEELDIYNERIQWYQKPDKWKLTKAKYNKMERFRQKLEKNKKDGTI